MVSEMLSDWRIVLPAAVGVLGTPLVARFIYRIYSDGVLSGSRRSTRLAVVGLGVIMGVALLYIPRTLGTDLTVSGIPVPMGVSVRVLNHWYMQGFLLGVPVDILYGVLISHAAVWMYAKWRRRL